MQPVAIIDLVDLIGRAATLALVEKFGGERLFISTKPDDAALLAGAIGMGAARAMVTRYQGTSIQVPAAYAMRARYHRSRGLNDGAIGVRLGIMQAHVAELLDVAERRPRSASDRPGLMRLVALIDLIDLIGRAATLSLVEKFGGERLSISIEPDDDAILARAIGMDAASSMIDRFQGTAIQVPTAYAMRARLHRSRGLNDGAIAIRLGITQAHVAELLN